VKGKSLGFIVSAVLAVTVKGQTIVDSFPSPGSEPRGLAWDGEYLWCSDAGIDSVYKLDTFTGDIASDFSFNIYDDYGGITWSIDSTIWLANGSYVYEIDPSTGKTIHSFSCPGG